MHSRHSLALLLAASLTACTSARPRPASAPPPSSSEPPPADATVDADAPQASASPTPSSSPSPSPAPLTAEQQRMARCYAFERSLRATEHESSASPPSDEDRLGTVAFALDLYAQLAATPGNFAFAPASLQSALAMVREGARGETASEIAQATHLTLEPAASATLLSARRRRWQSANGANAEIHSADRLFADAGLSLLPAFEHTLARTYGSSMARTDFRQHADRARDEINRWTAAQTRGHIREIVPEGSFDPRTTRFVLIDALYFRGRWAQPFHRDETSDAPFHLDDGTTVTVPMMNGSARGWRATDTGVVQVAELRYRGDAFALDLIAPSTFRAHDARLDCLEHAMTPARLAYWLRERDVDDDALVVLPRFGTHSTAALREVLSAMGMARAFDVAAADFGGVATLRPDERIYLQQVFHQVTVDVDEQGTVATAATAVVGGMRGRSIPMPMTFDHPFVFVLREVRSGTILFMGRLADPRG